MAQDNVNKANDRNDKPTARTEAPALNNPDAQAARNASGTDVAKNEATRTNASDGSLRDRAKSIAAQEESIEIVCGDRTASRTDKKSERELLREKANRPENIDTQGLAGIASDASLPEDKRALAGIIQEMRTQSKALDTPTAAIDEYAREALKNELKTRSQRQPQTIDDQESCGSFSTMPEKGSITIGSKTYPADQVIAQANIQNPVVSDATNARATDVVKERTLLYGHVSEPEVWDKVSKLPVKTQAEVILTAVRAHIEHWAREEVDRKIGALIGTTQGIGSILQDVATINDFSHACITGDKETAAKMGEEFGNSMARTMISGVNVLKLSDQYLQELGASGDWTKPAKDLANFSAYMNQKWAELPPKEQERLKYQFSVEVGGNLLLPGGPAKIFKAAKFSEVLPNIGKIATKVGGELSYLPEDIKKAGKAITKLCKQTNQTEMVTAEGVTIKTNEHVLMHQADDLHGQNKPGDMKQIGAGAAAEVEHSEGIGWLAKERKFKAGEAIPKEAGIDLAKEMREDLKKVCDDIDERNIAFAEIDIPGLPQKLVAVHGKFSPPGTVEKSLPHFLKSFPSGFLTRSSDSEFKILDDIAKRITKETKGSLVLFSEQMPCPQSCKKVIDKFREEFPQITFPEVNWAYKTQKERLHANSRGKE